MACSPRRTCSALALLLVVAGVATARADDAADFRDASSRRDIDALERIGGTQSPWADDAWVEASRIAEQTGDYARARRDLEQAIATSRALARTSTSGAGSGSSVRDAADSILVRRAEGDLLRLTRTAGEKGEWAGVIVEEQRLLPALQTPGDPRDALRALEKLVREHPEYPRAPMLMVQIAAGWEREGDADRALTWLAEAVRIAKEPLDRLRARADRIRVLTRAGNLSEAEQELDALARGTTTPNMAGPRVDTATSRGLIGALRDNLERAKIRRSIRWAMSAVLVVLMAAAAFTLRRAFGSWRAAGRRLLRPPSETLFLIPIAAVLIIVSSTGNPLVGRAIWRIAIVGIVVSWITGALLAGSHVTLRRALAHAVCAILAVGAATYIVIDRGHLVDFLADTWRDGPER